MRQAVLLLAATAAALVTPDEFRQKHISPVESHPETSDHDAVQAWWTSSPDADSIFSSLESEITESIQRSTVDSWISLVDSGEQDEDEDHPHPPHHPPEHPPHHPPEHPPHHPPHGPPHGGHGHPVPDKTIYELIKESNHTTKFAALVDEFDDIKELLNNTSHNHTLFVPTNRAFERLLGHHHGHHNHSDDKHPPEHKKPSKHFLLSLLQYHISPGLYSLRRLHHTLTIPTTFHPSSLGSSNHHPQRIRVSRTPILPLLTHLNFHAHILPGRYSTIPATNGLIHPLSLPLLPPPNTTTLIRLLPGHFSTLALALETTGLGAEWDALEDREGGTVFAPTNGAWKALGARANAFLFSEKGKKFLKGLVRYHFVVGETAYSDVLYQSKDGEDDDGEAETERGGWRHVDLESWLGGKVIGVDVRQWRGVVSVLVNGRVRVVVRDGVAGDGVLQIVERVLIPPRKFRREEGEEEQEEGEIGVEELKSRLEPYLEEADGGREDAGDL